MDKDYIKFHEEERERIARDLHDSTVQNLTHLVHKLEIVSKYIDSDPIQAKLELNVIRSLLKDTIKDTRNLIFDLRPMSFDDFGFRVSLQDFFDCFTDRYQIEFEYDIDEQVNQLSETILINLYRIIQEFSINTVKHAEAEIIKIDLHIVDNHVVMKLSDDGKGCDLSQINQNRHFGLNIMKERVQSLDGSCSFDSSIGKGFVFECSISVDCK